MNVNSAIITDTSRAVTESSVSAYRDAIAAHIDADWTSHAPVKLHNAAFAEEISGYTIVGTPASAISLRLLLTHALAGTEVTAAFILPAIVQVGVFPPEGSAPVVLRQPVTQAVRVGELIHLSVYAASASAMIYQWQKNTLDIVGAVGTDYDIPAAALTDQALYRVRVTNAISSTYSDSAQITVSS